MCPATIYAYFQLTRLDRPLGILLLYILPCWWGITLADPLSLNTKLLALFALGATFIRGAGCTFNDIIDQDIDRHIARTQKRPLAQGKLSLFQAMMFFCLQGIGGLIVLFYLPYRCWLLSSVQLVLLLLYPFMKRMTYWPQLFLGFAMNFGVVFGAVATIPLKLINWPAVLSLYGAGIAWTIGYDTIYALQDKEDDLKIGVKSTAILFDNHIKLALTISYGMMFALLAYVGYLAKGGFAYYSIIGLGMVATAGQLFYLNPSDPTQCQKTFTNPYLGWLVWGGLLSLHLY